MEDPIPPGVAMGHMSKTEAGAAVTSPTADAEIPRVSVVIPCHNYAQFLGDAVESALSQEGVVVDVTIVDDASTDDSQAIALGWQARDERVRVKIHSANAGHIATFNEALASARAPYVVKLDPDDVLPRGALRRAAAVLDAHPDVAFVYGPVVPFSGPVPTTSRTVGSRRLKVWSGRRWAGLRLRRLRNVIYQPEVMIRARALELVGGHRDTVPAASDLNLWLRLSAVGAVARIGGVAQGYYRKHQWSMQHTVHAGKLLDFRARRDAFRDFLNDPIIPREESERWRRINDNALGRDALRLAFEELEDGTPRPEFLEEARALHPNVVRSVSWRNCVRRLADPLENGILVRVERLVRDLDGRIRYRVWRRFGI